MPDPWLDPMQKGNKQKKKSYKDFIGSADKLKYRSQIR